MKNKLTFAGLFLLFVLITSCQNPIIQQIWDLRTVTFDSNGGSHISSQDLLKGRSAERPVDPVRGNYFFSGWYLDNDTFLFEWDFNVIPSESLTLFAKWFIEVIPFAAVTVTAPQTYAIPDNQATSTGNFSVEGVEWTPSHNSFLPETSYTVSVMLKAYENHIFTPETIALINGNPAGITLSADGFSATLTYQFAPTEPEGVRLTVEHITEKAPLPNDNITLSQTGSGGLNSSIIIGISEEDIARIDPGSIKWEIQGAGHYAYQTITEFGATFYLNARDIRYNAVGGGTLRLTVSIGGIPYQVNINFTIVE